MGHALVKTFSLPSRSIYAYLRFGEHGKLSCLVHSQAAALIQLKFRVIITHLMVFIPKPQRLCLLKAAVVRHALLLRFFHS